MNLTERAVFTYRETDASRRTREEPSILIGCGLDAGDRLLDAKSAFDWQDSRGDHLVTLLGSRLHLLGGRQAKAAYALAASGGHDAPRSHSAAPASGRQKEGRIVVLQVPA
jgi:hypothetical protein